MLSIGSYTQGASEKYIQTFGCSWLRQIMDIGLARGFESMDCVIFSAGTCDSLQNVSDIWRKVFPEQFAYNLTFPVLTDTEAAVNYLQHEFETLIKGLANQFSNNGTEMDLDRSIDLYNTKRKHLQELAGMVSERKFNYRDLAKILLLTDIVPVEVANPYLDNLLDDARSSPRSDLPDSPRLLIAGGMFDSYPFWEIPEINHVVMDDLSFGTRNFDFQISVGNDLHDYARAYLERTPDPTALDMEKRLNGLKEMIKTHEADGVILLGIKWCDPDTFEFVPMQNSLKEQDVPYLKLETTPDLSNLQQLQTRLSAFIEMLS